MMWCIWKERNSQNFEDYERTMAELKGWMVAINNSHFSNFLEFLNLCSS
jgi:hypothetical protein